jgi:hypothetical protein
MKSIAIACALLLGGGLGLAQTNPRDPQASPSPVTRTVEMLTGQLVSKDGRAKTITVRNLSNIKDRAVAGAEPAAPAEGGTADNVVLHLDGKVLARLGNVKVGDSIIMTCRADGGARLSTAPAQPPTPTACVTVTGIDTLKGSKQ